MGESKEYMTLPEENGSINISEEVIAAIAVGAVRDVEGVSGMMTAMGGSVTDLVHNKKNAQKGAKGVKIDMTGAALVLAAGCREIPIGALALPGTRPAGIFTAGQAQRMVNLQGLSLGRRIVILGSGDVGLIMARQFALAGCSVEAVNIHVGGVTLA